MLTVVITRPTRRFADCRYVVSVPAPAGRDESAVKGRDCGDRAAVAVGPGRVRNLCLVHARLVLAQLAESVAAGFTDPPPEGRAKKPKPETPS